MKKLSTLSSFLLFAGINLVTSTLVLAQSSPVTADVQFSNGDTITVADFSEQISVQPNELVSITIHFPADAVGQPIVVDTINGGITSVGSSIPVVNSDGTLSFAFVAPRETGAKSLAIRKASATYQLQFSVANASRP
jgi:hypothetical protein